MKKLFCLLVLFSTINSCFLLATDNSSIYVDNQGIPNDLWDNKLEQAILRINQMTSIEDWGKNKKAIYDFEAFIKASALEDDFKKMSILAYNSHLFAFWSHMAYALETQSLREKLNAVGLTREEKFLLKKAEENSFGMDPSGVTNDRVEEEMDKIVTKLKDITNNQQNAG